MPTVDLSDIKGQEHAKRGLEVAVAGGHHILFVGPTGVGKTMLAHAAQGILPSLTAKEFGEHQMGAVALIYHHHLLTDRNHQTSP